MEKNLHTIITNSGIIECFPEGLKDTEGNLVYAETSAVIYYNNTIIIASDKDIPEYSHTFSFPYSCINNAKGTIKQKELKYLTNKTILDSKKIEDFALTLDRKYLLAVSAFDRYDSASSQFDTYNSLLCWHVNDEKNVRVVSPTSKNGIVSSIGLRNKLLQALEKYSGKKKGEYFKIEGITIIPDNRILFGVREYGYSYGKFEYVVLAISVSFRFVNGIITLNDDFCVVYDFNYKNIQNIHQPVGLSSIEYDSLTDRIYILTSFECEKHSIGGYIWELKMDEFERKLNPRLILGKGGDTLQFFNKPEGLAVIDKETLFIICDDDRILDYHRSVGKNYFKRHPHQAVYMVVKVK